MARRTFVRHRQNSAAPGSGNSPRTLVVERLEDRRLLAPLAVDDFYRLPAGSTLQTASAPATESRRVFFSDFNAGAPTEFSGITTLAGVAGYNGIGPPGNRFSGSLLRNQTGMAFDYLEAGYSPSVPTRLTLTNLPAHTSLDLRFLFAALDSWDGNTHADGVSPAEDVFAVTVDGRSIFAKTFDNHNRADQSYAPASGTLLDWGRHLGFNTNYVDAAYDLGQEPAFSNIPHDASTVRIEWFTYGEGWTAGFREDEGWGIDNVEVVVNGVPVAPTGVLFNDVDPVGEGLVAILDSPPAHGELQLRPNGSFDYTPAAGYAGADSFTYHALDDNQASSNTVTVQLLVEPAALAASPRPDSYTVTASNPFSTALPTLVKNLSTGFDQAGGSQLAEGAADQDYRLGAGGGLAQAVPLVLTGDKPNPTYVTNGASSASRWIGVATPGEVNAPPGVYYFDTSVDLTGFNPQTAYLADLRIAVDNSLLGVWIDDVAVLSETINGAGYFRELGMLGQGAFHAGLNRIRFVVRNTGTIPNPLSLRVEGSVMAIAADAQAGLLANDQLPPVTSSTALFSVPASADPWLAGMPNGSFASYGDRAPEYSPVLVEGLLFGPGDGLQFAAEGLSGNSHFVAYFPTYPPDGGPINGQSYWEHYGGPENGLADIKAPINSLVGVFLDDSVPSLYAPPATLDFRPGGNVAGGYDYELLHPGLRQVFFIGDGLTSKGLRQTVDVPGGATRLYLGTLDGFYWFDNVGRFDVRVYNTRVVDPQARPEFDSVPQHGTLEEWDPSGRFRYMPNFGYVGLDSFSYRLRRTDGSLSDPVTITLNVVAREGDIDLNGVVDLTDFGILKSNFGRAANRSEGDLNGDGTVGLTDFGLLKANFGVRAAAAVARAVEAALTPETALDEVLPTLSNDRLALHSIAQRAQRRS
jgi:hypothetical protein